MRMRTPLPFRRCLLLLSIWAGPLAQLHADDPCPWSEAPAGTEKIRTRQVMPAGMPPEVIQRVQPMLSDGYRISFGYVVRLSPTLAPCARSVPDQGCIYLVESDNIDSTRDQASIRYNVAAVERDNSGLRVYEVKQYASGDPALMQKAAAYRRQGNLYIRTSFNARGDCRGGLIHKVDERYLQLFPDPATISGPLDYPAIERQFGMVK